MPRRRRTSIGEDIFDMASQVPWWVGVTVAGVIWVVGLMVVPTASADPFKNGLRPLVRLLFGIFSFICLVGAGVSAIKGLSRRKLLDSQRGIDSIRQLPWREFEQLVGEAYRRQGYDIEETGGGGADGGIDLVLRGHGETVLVQCKQWRLQQVGVDKVRELFGVLTAERADRAILVTSGAFTKDALSFKVGKPLTLVDGPALASLVSQVRVAPVAPSSPRPAQPSFAETNPNTEHRTLTTDPTCPRCSSPMVIRTARRGANAGGRFYGCTRYPACKGILNA